MRSFLVGLSLLLLVSLPVQTAYSADTGVFRAPFDTSGLVQTVQTQSEANSVEARLRAARAALDLYQLSDGTEPQWLRKAETSLERLDDDSREPTPSSDVNQANTHYLNARAMAARVQREGIPANIDRVQSIREELARALDLAENHYGAMVKLAHWHYRYSQGARRYVFDANPDQVDPLIERALEASERSIEVLYIWALVLDERDRSDERNNIVEEILESEPKSLQERYLQLLTDRRWG